TFFSVDVAENSEALGTTQVVVQTVTQLTLQAPPTTVAGSPFQVTVRALDAGGSLVPGYQGKVHFSGGDTLAGLPADYTFSVQAGDAGTHTFTVVLQTAGTQSLRVVDTNRSNLTAATTVEVVAGPA